MANKDDDGRKRGFPESFNALLAKYGSRVQHFIERRMRGAPRHNIEDVSQETYVRLLRLLPGHPIKNPDAYILTVAANVVKEFALRDSRERKLMNYDSDEVDRLSELAEDGWVNGPQNAAEAEQELAWIRKHLPPILLATLILYGRGERTYEEVGRILGKSPHAVKKYLAEARARCQVRANSVNTRGTVR
jgi:RNA polymerase sigma factor (sigma-70 family)